MTDHRQTDFFRRGIIVEEYRNKIGTKEKALLFALLSIFLGIALAAAALIIWVWLSSGKSIAALLVTFFIPVLWIGVCLGYAYYIAAYMGMRFTVDREGVGVRYPFFARRLIRWEDMQQVCICNEIAVSRQIRMGRPVICFVRKGEKEGVFSGRWKMRSIFHLFGVVTIDYTQDFLDLVKKNCPFEVVDIRGRRTYWIDR